MIDKSIISFRISAHFLGCKVVCGVGGTKCHPVVICALVCVAGYRRTQRHAARGQETPGPESQCRIQEHYTGELVPVFGCDIDPVMIQWLAYHCVCSFSVFIVTPCNLHVYSGTKDCASCTMI